MTGPYLGHEGVRRWWDDIADAFENLHYELPELVDVDEDRVVTSSASSGDFGSWHRGRFRLGSRRHNQRGKDRLGDRLSLTRPCEEGAGLSRRAASDP
jgi:hypothetical protein